MLFGMVHSQQLQFSNVSDKLGLPTQECYNVMQDSKGYIWISTEAGLCKFNGEQSLVFNKKNGLPEGSTYVVKEDKNKVLWMVSSGNRILTYTHDSLQETGFSNEYENILKNSLDLTYLLDFADNNELYLNTQGKTFNVQLNTNKITPVYRTDSSANYFLIQTANGLVAINGGYPQSRLANIKRAERGYVKIVLSHENKLTEMHLPFSKAKMPQWRVLTCNTKHGCFVSFDNYLFKINHDQTYTYYELPERIISLNRDGAEGLWVGMMKEGVYYYPDLQSMKLSTRNLKGYSVTGTCEDRESGIWCTTLEKGVFYCRNKKVMNYANSKGWDKAADFLKCAEGRIFASSSNNELVEICGESMVHYPLGFKENYPISDVLKYDKGWIITGKNIVVKTDDHFKNLVYITTQNTHFMAGVNQVVRVSNKRMLGIHFGHIIEVTPDYATERRSPLEAPGRCVEYEGHDELLYGCKDGLYRMNVNTYATEKIKGIEANVSSILKSSSGKVWVTTTGGGLYILIGDSALNISTLLKIPTDRFFDVAEDLHLNTWVGSNIGLICIYHEPSQKQKYVVYNTLNGLPSNEVYNVAADSTHIYISTIEGICSFLIQEKLENHTPPPIYFNSLKINEKTVSYSGVPLILTHYENSLQILFDAITFKEMNNSRLIYRLKGQDNLLHANEGNKLLLNNLDPGKYELSVYAINNNHILSKRPVLLRFEILKPFWKTGWFIVACILILALIIYLLVMRTVNGIRKKEKEKTNINKQLAEYQLTALQAQMNPHFIFNAINSIQRFILKKSENEAYDYLAKFSKLIRMVLNHSQETTLPLKQELEMLKLYVELEQLRFDNSFDFKITVAPDVNEYELYLPGMLIQPYIENAIWHGLMNLEKTKQGSLHLDIKISGDLLKISIIDNGIGRKLSQTFKKEKAHPSIGMKLTEQRLLMINKISAFESARVTVYDLYAENNVACGTRVDIIIPIQDIHGK
jgi:ligand-binding sensor domain-containing protein